jgi:hypothetical protein
MSLMYLVSLAARYASKLYAVYAKKMPFYIEHWEDFITGGIDDMATRTVVDWKNVIHAIETGKTFQNESWIPTLNGENDSVLPRDHHPRQEIYPMLDLIMNQLKPKTTRKRHGVEFSIQRENDSPKFEAPPSNAFGYTGLT